MHDDNALFSEFGMDLWRKMSQDLNYNVMFSPRGIINLSSFRCSDECLCEKRKFNEIEWY